MTVLRSCRRHRSRQPREEKGARQRIRSDQLRLRRRQPPRPTHGVGRPAQRYWQGRPCGPGSACWASGGAKARARQPPARTPPRDTMRLRTGRSHRRCSLEQHETAARRLSGSHQVLVRATAASVLRLKQMDCAEYSLTLCAATQLDDSQIRLQPHAVPSRRKLQRRNRRTEVRLRVAKGAPYSRKDVLPQQRRRSVEPRRRQR
jgi:hypothetical protein